MTAIPHGISDARCTSSGLRVVDPVGSLRAGETQLDLQLRYVQENSSFYRAKWGAPRGRVSAGDLPTLPFTTRDELQSDQAENGPFGSYLAASPHQIARVHRTSGSTGKALLIALSGADVDSAVERGAACFRAAGVLRSDVIVHCLNYCMWSGGVTDHLCLERAGAAVIPFGVGNTTELIEILLRVKPTGIHCTPSYLGRLEDRLRIDFGLSPLDLGLRIGLFGGEPGLQDRRFRSGIEKKWGFRAVDANYGMSEVLSIFGSECDARCGLHFEGGDAVLPEIRKADSDETLAFEPGSVGELVLTHLQRQCQPLVRYRTGDVVEVLSTDRCACGRGTPRFRVVGRVDEMIVVRGLNVFPSAIAEVIHQFGELLSGEFNVLVNACDPISRVIIKAESAGIATDLTAIAKLRDALFHQLRLRPEIEVVPRGALTGGEGKAKRVRRVL